MALNLFVKDLKIGIYFLVPVFLLQVLNVPGTAHAPGFRLMTGVGFTILVATGVTLIDLRYELESTFASLPVTRATIIRGRSLTAAFGVILGGLVYFGVGAIVATWSGAPEAVVAPLLRVETVSMFLLCTILPICLFFPCYYGIGGASGWIAFGALLSLVAAVPSALAGIGGSQGRVHGSSSITQFEGRLMGVLMHPGELLTQQLGPVAGIVVMLAVLSACAAAAVSLSTWLYARRDL